VGRAEVKAADQCAVPIHNKGGWGVMGRGGGAREMHKPDVVCKLGARSRYELPVPAMLPTRAIVCRRGRTGARLSTGPAGAANAAVAGVGALAVDGAEEAGVLAAAVGAVAATAAAVGAALPGAAAATEGFVAVPLADDAGATSVREDACANAAAAPTVAVLMAGVELVVAAAAAAGLTATAPEMLGREVAGPAPDAVAPVPGFADDAAAPALGALAAALLTLAAAATGCGVAVPGVASSAS